MKRVSTGHSNILTLVDYFETLNNLYLVIDLALGGDLFDRICKKGSYFEADAANIVHQVLSGVAYLHGQGVVHGDLKPENLLFRTPEDDADLLIADFSMSKMFYEDDYADKSLPAYCGYYAPEMIKQNRFSPTSQADMWAIGVITYFLLCGYTPFDRDNNMEEIQAIIVADYSFTPVEYWRGVSAAARDFIISCLTIDPEKRITAHEALNHPFLTDKPLSRRNTGQLSLIPPRRRLKSHIWAVVFVLRIREEERKSKTVNLHKIPPKKFRLVNMTTRERVTRDDEAAPAPRAGVSRDPNAQKLHQILNDAALRLLFRENLRDTHCEENLSFYLDVDEFLKACESVIKNALSSSRPGKNRNTQGLDAFKEIMASANRIHNAFFAPGSPFELNIDHLLRNQLATCMTKTVGQDGAMIDNLNEITRLFEEAQISIFELMASVSKTSNLSIYPANSHSIPCPSL